LVYSQGLEEPGNGERLFLRHTLQTGISARVHAAAALPHSNGLRRYAGADGDQRLKWEIFGGKQGYSSSVALHIVAL